MVSLIQLSFHSMKENLDRRSGNFKVEVIFLGSRRWKRKIFTVMICGSDVASQQFVVQIISGLVRSKDVELR